MGGGGLEPWQRGDLIQDVAEQPHGHRDSPDAHAQYPEALAHRDQEQHQRKQHGRARPGRHLARGSHTSSTLEAVTWGESPVCLAGTGVGC